MEIKLQPLTALSPIDGRYHHQVSFLAKYFSEYALITYRIKVEILYFLFLGEKEIFALSPALKKYLLALTQNFSISDAQKIKDIEKETNHDVKAVEYFLKEKLSGFGADNLKEWIHFGLTSQDINNTAIPMMWKEALTDHFLPGIKTMINSLKTNSLKWKDVTMLARTHGQPASPTILGKEIMVFAARLDNQLALFQQIPFSGKFGGATGNLNAHYISFPGKDWHKIFDEFLVKKLGLQRQYPTTQIEHYDFLAAHFDAIKRINTILIDLCRDMWAYVSLEYFSQKIIEGETGSSAMPHKVNPIDFENAEGNLGIANALLEHFAAKLPVSRLQRDLTDSTVIRNIGVPVAHTMLAISSINKGLQKLILNENKIQKDLDENWAVVAEAIQTILRRESFPKPYEVLKKFSRGKKILGQKELHAFIDSLTISQKLKKELKKVTPNNYRGVFKN